MANDECIECNGIVTILEEALQCVECSEWQHRICGTGVTETEYRAAYNNNETIDWRCARCFEFIPNAESSRIGKYGDTVLPGIASWI